MTFPTFPASAPQWILLILLAVILLAPVIARQARLPGILGLIAAGIIIGPNVAGLLERDGFVELLGGAGLLFLMFMAGLELDVKASMSTRRNDTLSFGAATFAFPLLVGTGALLLWGFEPLAAVLIASCWSSHTLVSYPIFQRLRIVQQRAVATAIGATMVTNVAALVVLAVVVAVHSGGEGIGSWVVLGGGLVLLTFVTMWVLPRLTRWFFAGLGDDRLSQVLYVLVMLFAASALAAIVGLEPIVGSFFAGLGLSEHVPKNGILGERLTFLGDVLLVPVFLISVGMLIDPMTLFQGTTVALLALTFTLQSLGGKFLAALTFGKLRRFSRDEIGAMYSLTAAEAAATLAAIFVGFQVGLFGQEVVDAVVLVIMVTCFTSTVLADRYGSRLERPQPSRQLGATIVVPVANPATAAQLTRIAAAIAAADSGTVAAVNVLGRHVVRSDVDEHRAVLLESEAAALRSAVEARSRVRIDDSTTDGILHEVVEQDATGLLLGWKGYANRREHLFGSVIDDLLDQVDVPVLLCRTGADEPVRRVLLAPPLGGAAPGGGPLAAEVADRLATHLRTPVVALDHAGGTGETGHAVGPQPISDTGSIDLAHTSARTADALVAEARPGDLLVVPAAGQINGQLSEIARRCPELTLLIVNG